MNKSIMWVTPFLIISLASGQPVPTLAATKEIPVVSIRLQDIALGSTDKGNPPFELSTNEVPTPPKSKTAHMVLTAYTKDDEGMDGLGITASGKLVEEGVTIAAPPGIPFGTKLYIPALNHTYTVTDRGGHIKGNRLDVYIADIERALIFGVQKLDVVILS